MRMKKIKEVVCHLRKLWVVPVLAFGAATICPAQAADEAGMQVLTRGPIHEAFAEASMTGATAGAIVTMAPPEPISELPPDQRPDGANVSWIPGYWSYDDDRSNFIWVSGVWRDLPPHRQWVPGYWTPAGRGSQWISGFWGDTGQTELTYLPAPPQPLEVGPNSPAPHLDSLWSPGNWVWQQSRYNWQPGYWVAQQADWVWTPSHYSWTPRGYVYVAGYWDHDFVHRGVMFAPVYYDQPVYRRSNYNYSPSIVIDLGVIAASLFVQPRSNHYYFGDYYDARYENRGIYAWNSKHVSQLGDDPMYVNYRSSQLQRDSDWVQHNNEQFQYRRDHADARPPQTWALQANYAKNRKSNDPENVSIGKSLVDAIQSRILPQRFTTVNMDERKQIESRGRDVHKFQSDRAKIETEHSSSDKSGKTVEISQPIKLQLPVSPVAARHADGANAPPPLPDAPKPRAVDNNGRNSNTWKSETKVETPASVDNNGRHSNTWKSETKAETPASVDNNGRNSSTWKSETKVETPASQEKQVKSEQVVQPEPLNTDASLTRTNRKPKVDESKSSTTHQDSPTQVLAPEPKSSKKEDVAVRSEVVTHDNVEPPKHQNVDSGQEIKAHKPATVQNEKKTVAPERKSYKTVAPKVDQKSQKSQHKPQPTRTDTKKGQSSEDQTSSTDDNNKKNDVK